MSKIALLTAVKPFIEEGNYLRLSVELLARGHEVHLGFLDPLTLSESRVMAPTVQVITPLLEGEPFPETRPTVLDSFDAIWILSLGWRQSFLDKIQLLQSLAARVRIINSPDALMHLKSKYFLASLPELIQYPETHASSDADYLFDRVQQGGEWIVKPPAGSLGREVFRINRDDPNAHVILQTLCGPENDEYALLQQYVPEISQGEKRVLIAGGEPIGQYRRLPGKDHRTNLMQGGDAEACDLSGEETAYCQRVGEFLMSKGAEFVGMDLVYPWVIELNVVCPGGLATIESLTGEILAPEIVNRIFPNS